ncbi:LacI family DNA-binding transcriptional regulator [Phycisphaeraceae bacterium D3-23]
MASVRQIAKQAGVSTATVSRVMNNSPQVSGEAKRKVMTVINGSNYMPTVGKKSTTNIAYLFTDSITLSSPYDAGVMAGLSAGLEQRRLDLLILNARTCRESGETFSQMFRRKGVQGVIVRTTAGTREVCKTILESGVPAVVLGDQIEGHEDVCVDVDSRDASRDAVEHLIGLGHRSVGFCTNIVDDKDHLDRFEGYREALANAGIEFDGRLMFRVPANRQGGEQFVRRLAAMVDRPSAVFVADPATCVGMLTEARRQGIDIPNDLSIVGFDDSEARFGTSPELTAVCQDSELLGRHAMAVLMSGLSSGPLDSDGARQLRAWLEVNATTAAVPATTEATD